VAAERGGTGDVGARTTQAWSTVARRGRELGNDAGVGRLVTLRLLPCDVVARVAPAALHVAQLEVQLAQRLAETGSPVAALERRVEPCVHERDGFVVTLWTYHEPGTAREVPPADYADALGLLHAGMRRLDVPTPHFTDRAEQAQQLVASRDLTPALADAERDLLSTTLRRLRRAIGEHGGAEQLLHGEPHPGNLPASKNRLLFIDLETCCRGPVEFTLAHAGPRPGLALFRRPPYGGRMPVVTMCAPSVTEVTAMGAAHRSVLPSQRALGLAGRQRVDAVAAPSGLPSPARSARGPPADAFFSPHRQGEAVQLRPFSFTHVPPKAG
jgi:hypothetical protein